MVYIRDLLTFICCTILINCLKAANPLESGPAIRGVVTLDSISFNKKTGESALKEIIPKCQKNTLDYKPCKRWRQNWGSTYCTRSSSGLSPK